jgi:putative membrane protein
MHWFEGHYGGMHIIWWVIWVIFIVWIFATPWEIPGQKNEKGNSIGSFEKEVR